LVDAKSPNEQVGSISSPQYSAHPTSLDDKSERKWIRNEHVQRMFNDTPRMRNMIAAWQMDFIGNVLRGPHDCPAQQMLNACCDNIRLIGWPFLHNKDHIITSSFC
jgi:hypothetical protein